LFISIDEARDKVSSFRQTCIDAYPDVERLIDAGTAYLSLAREAGLSGDLIEFASRARQATIAVETLVRGVYAMYAATGPIGWLIGFAGFAAGTIMLSQQMQIRRPRY